MRNRLTSLLTFLRYFNGGVLGGTHGSEEDQSNFRRILDGSFDGKTLEMLVAHPHSQMAKLQPQHVLALRLYTSSSYSRVNDPLRKTPPERPHPFAATTWYCDQGIKMLRAVAAQRDDAHVSNIDTGHVPCNLAADALRHARVLEYEGRLVVSANCHGPSTESVHEAD